MGRSTGAGSAYHSRRYGWQARFAVFLMAFAAAVIGVTEVEAPVSAAELESEFEDVVAAAEPSPGATPEPTAGSTSEGVAPPPQEEAVSAATANQLPYNAGALQVYPSNRYTNPDGTSTLYTTSTRPTYRSKVGDPDQGQTVQALFDVWQDSTQMIGKQPGGMVASGGMSASGPSLGVLQLSKLYTMKAWARDSAGAVSAQPSVGSLQFILDNTMPSPPTVTSADYKNDGGWYKGAGQVGAFTFTPTAAENGYLVYWLDNGPRTTLTTTAARTVNITPPTDGTHVLHVMAKDKATNPSTVVNYTFNVGAGTVTSPQPGARTARRLDLAAKGRQGFTGVTFQYRRGAAAPWTNIPAAHVERADGAAVTWPVPTTAATEGTKADGLRWDAVATLGGDGTAEVRAAFTGGTAANTAPVDMTADQQASGADTEQVGPGDLNLLTGDYTLSAEDANVLGLSISRTASSRDPALGDTDTGLAAPFGPQWAMGGVAEVADNDVQALRTTSATSLQLVLDDGTTIQFAKTSGTGTATAWAPEPGEEDYRLTGDGTSTAPFLLTDTDGAETKFKPGAGGLQVVETTTPAKSTTANTTRYAFEPITVGGVSKLRLKRMVAPTSAATNLATCDTATPPVGCRVLELVYTPATAAAPAAGALGAFPNRIAQVKLHAAEPGAAAGQATMRATAVAEYRYDSTGRLRQAFDPRLPGLVTAYEYDGGGRVTKLTPPGELPWTFGYGAASSSGDSNTGRLLTVRRPTLQPGTTDQVAGTATTSIVYDVPRSKTAGGPHDMTASATAAWGQTGTSVPADATAVFPPDSAPPGHVGGTGTGWDWTRATVTYLDANGREVNTATPGGHIDATSHDEHGNPVRELTAANRSLALSPDDDPQLVELNLAASSIAERAEQLSTLSVYDSTGLRELEEYGPLHLLTAGGAPEPGRTHTVTSYDEGRPTTSPVSNMPTTTRIGARLATTDADTDVRTTKTELNWTLGTATKTVTDPGGLNETRTTAYDAQGRVTTTSMPKSSGTDAGTTTTTYYTAAANATVPACGNRPEWADLVCRVAPAGTITGAPAGQPDRLPTKTTTYTLLGAPDVITETSVDGAGAAQIRRTDTDYDPAGRSSTVTVTGPGAAVPPVTTAYSPDSGQPTTVTAGSDTIRTERDLLGRPVSYADADGAITRTQYDNLGRPIRISSGDGSTTTYAYDHDKEPRGLATSITDSVAGTIAGRFDPDGSLVEQNLPGGILMRDADDPTGEPTSRRWTRTSPDGTTTELLHDKITTSAHGQWTSHTGGASSQELGYDAAGRLQQVKDTVGDTCTTRVYGFDANSNHTHRKQAAGTPGDACPAAPALGTPDHAYDGADRIVDAGHRYDAFGRTTAIPGAEQVEYYANDRVRSVRQNAAIAQTWTLDPAMRPSTATTTGLDPDTNTVQTETTTNHYGGGTDSPDWVDEGAGQISRNVTGLDDDLIAITGRAGEVHWQITNLHDDVVLDVTAADAVAETAFDYDEYGDPRGGQLAARYGWFGGKQRAADTPAGLMMMGVRLYNPNQGRFLQVDPVVGGNANAYDYVNADPYNQVDLDGQKKKKKCKKKGKSKKCKKKKGKKCKKKGKSKKCKKKRRGTFQTASYDPRDRWSSSCWDYSAIDGSCTRRWWTDEEKRARKHCLWQGFWTGMPGWFAGLPGYAAGFAAGCIASFDPWDV